MAKDTWNTRDPAPAWREETLRRNNIWLAKNRWFDEELIPVLKKRISKLI